MPGLKNSCQLNLAFFFFFFFTPDFDGYFSSDCYFFSCCHSPDTGGDLQSPCGALSGCPLCEQRAKLSEGTVSTYRNELGWGAPLISGDNQRWVDGQTVNHSSLKRHTFLPCVFLFLAGPLSSASASQFSFASSLPDSPSEDAETGRKRSLGEGAAMGLASSCESVVRALVDSSSTCRCY